MADGGVVDQRIPQPRMPRSSSEAPKPVPGAPAAATADPVRRRRGLPGIAALLALLLLIPVASLAAVTGPAAFSTRAERRAAIDVQRDIKTSSSLMSARSLVVDEGLASVALTNAAESGLGVAALTRLSGVDYAAAVRKARPLVDSNQSLRAHPTLAADLRELSRLRPRVDARTASLSDVLGFFTKFAGDIDRVWSGQLDGLRRSVGFTSRQARELSVRINVLPTAYALFTTAVQQGVYANSILRGSVTPPNVKGLIEANGAYQANAVAVAGRLGPRASAAWRALNSDPAVDRFQGLLNETSELALAGRASPLTGDAAAHTTAFADGQKWLDDLEVVLQGAAADVRDVAGAQEAAATRSFQISLAIFLLSFLLAAGAAVLLARSVVRPLRRLSATARLLADGDFATPALAASGPREVAETIEAVGDVAAVLAAVEAFTVTLANDPTAASLDSPLPGRTGRALQATLDRLRESVRESERQRLLMRDLASRDGLTGLLNRNAALELLRARLSAGQPADAEFVVLFVDLDGLKSINDTHGHKVGDDAIRIAAQALRDAAGPGDIVARLGGDEFIVVSGPVQSDGEVHRLADSLHGAIASIELASGETAVWLRCSIGIAVSEPGDTAEAVIHRADQALYSAKTRGRNQIRWHEVRSAR